MPRPKQRTPELRDHLLAVALSALEEDGVAAFTTRTVARRAASSVQALYELFGDKAGLVRAMFFEGFRQLGDALDAVVETDDPRADLAALLLTVRRFARGNPTLTEVMFARPFADFDPADDEQQIGDRVRTRLTRAVRRGVDEGRLAGNATDVAHVLLALVQGLWVQERAGWLGRSPSSVDRRWALGIQAALDGFSPVATGEARRHRR